MKIATSLVAAAMVVSMVPVASAESNYDANVNYLVSRAIAGGWNLDETMMSQISEIAGSFASVKLEDLNNGVDVGGVGGLHTGEVWFICDAFFGGSCGLTTVASGIPTCFAIPAHWALYIWIGNAVQSTSSASGGAFGYLYLWTENHAGLAPLVVASNGGVFTGSQCAFNYGFYAFTQGNGVFQD